MNACQSELSVPPVVWKSEEAVPKKKESGNLISPKTAGLGKERVRFNFGAVTVGGFEFKPIKLKITRITGIRETNTITLTFVNELLFQR